MGRVRGGDMHKREARGGWALTCESATHVCTRPSPHPSHTPPPPSHTPPLVAPALIPTSLRSPVPGKKPQREAVDAGLAASGLEGWRGGRPEKLRGPVLPHHSIRRIEGFLDPVTVVDVNVQVEHAGVVLEHVEDGQHNVVDVAEARRLGPLGVMQPPSPVDAHVRGARVETQRTVDRAPRVKPAVVVQAVEDGAVGQQGPPCTDEGGGTWGDGGQGRAPTVKRWSCLANSCCESGETRRRKSTYLRGVTGASGPTGGGTRASSRRAGGDVALSAADGPAAGHGGCTHSAAWNWSISSSVARCGRQTSILR
eukprot:scaffold2549_cov108-Isochrysis_galbana.AAC.10